MHRGYVKLWRRSIEDPLWQNWKVWRVFEYCLMKASHRPHDVMIGMQMIHLEPGQLIFGRHKASLETALTQQEIRTCMEKLKNWQKLTIKSTNKYSIISIINWDRYQADEIQINQQIEKQVTNKQPTSNHIQTHKECINTKNKERGGGNGAPPSRTRKPFIPPPIEEVVSFFLSKGYSETAARHAFEYYDTADWHDSGGKPVKNWKQKMIAVWFKDEYKQGETDGYASFLERHGEGQGSLRKS